MNKRTSLPSILLAGALVAGCGSPEQQLPRPMVPERLSTEVNVELVTLGTEPMGATDSLPVITATRDLINHLTTGNSYVDDRRSGEPDDVYLFGVPTATSPPSVEVVYAKDRKALFHGMLSRGTLDPDLAYDDGGAQEVLDKYGADAPRAVGKAVMAFSLDGERTLNSHNFPNLAYGTCKALRLLRLSDMRDDVIDSRKVATVCDAVWQAAKQAAIGTDFKDYAADINKKEGVPTVSQALFLELSPPSNSPAQ